MRSILIEDAVGMALCHDMTEYIPGREEKVAFKKGHIIRKEDIPRFHDMGKKKIFIWDLPDQKVHEDEAANRLANLVCGNGVIISSPHGGKVIISASIDGLLKINQYELEKLNRYEGIILTCLHSNQKVTKNKKIAATRIVPLFLEEKILARIEDKCCPIVEVKPFKCLNIGIIITGNEIYEGLREDLIGPILTKKIIESGSNVTYHTIISDSVNIIVDAIKLALHNNIHMLIITGGMSVDPDDVTAKAIEMVSDKIITYGAPVTPGAVFMLAYIGNIPILGLPGCIMYYKTTIFDIIYPRLQTGEILDRAEIIKLAHGGMCVECIDCRYPNCAFGK